MKKLFYLPLILLLFNVGCTQTEPIALEGIWTIKNIYLLDTDSFMEESEVFENIKFNICSNGKLYALAQGKLDALEWSLEGNNLTIFDSEDTLKLYIEDKVTSIEIAGKFPYYGEFSAELIRVDKALSYETFLVKNSYLKGYDELSIGDAFDSFFGSPNWEGLIAQDKQLYLNVSGEILLFNKNTKAELQFKIDSINHSFVICALELNGVPQSDVVIIALLDKMYGKEISEAEFYNPKPKLPAAPLNIYIFREISDSFTRLVTKRSNEFENLETIDQLKLTKEILAKAFEKNGYSYSATIRKIADSGFTYDEMQMVDIVLIPVIYCETDEEIKLIYTTQELEGINEIIRMVEEYKGY